MPASKPPKIRRVPYRPHPLYLRRLIADKGYSQSQAARAIGVSRRMFCWYLDMRAKYPIPYHRFLQLVALPDLGPIRHTGPCPRGLKRVKIVFEDYGPAKNTDPAPE